VDDLLMCTCGLALYAVEDGDGGWSYLCEDCDNFTSPQPVAEPYYEVTVRLPLNLYDERWFDRVADAAGEEAAVSGSVVPGSDRCDPNT
jgi:hypothetical protein